MRYALPRRLPTKAEREAAIRRTPLGEFFVWHDDTTSADVQGLRRVIDEAVDERPIQKYLERKPSLLVQHLGGGHGRWVIPQKRLGAEFVADFLIGDKCSFGHEWFLLELESPRAKMFKKSGDASATLIHALQQIQHWRVWLAKNTDYAARPRSEQGLGLTDIRANSRGWIIIGRRERARRPRRTISGGR